MGSEQLLDNHGSGACSSQLEAEVTRLGTVREALVHTERRPIEVRHGVSDGHGVLEYFGFTGDRFDDAEDATRRGR